jgi:hypothetical protein
VFPLQVKTTALQDHYVVLGTAFQLLSNVIDFHKMLYERYIHRWSVRQHRIFCGLWVVPSPNLPTTCPALQDLLIIIICRLGVMWRNMTNNEKEQYFSMAKEREAEHRKIYPGK